MGLVYNVISLLSPTTVFFIWLCLLSIPTESYSRNTSCTLH